MNKQGKQALIKVAEWLEDGAPHVVINDSQAILEFDMLYGGVPSEDDLGNCGTACCIAGAVVQFEDLMKPDADGSFPFFSEDVDDLEEGDTPQPGAGPLAQEFLGISEYDADRLFLPFNHFDHCESAEFSSPARAAAVVRHYLSTGEVSWDKFDLDGNKVA